MGAETSFSQWEPMDVIGREQTATGCAARTAYLYPLEWDDPMRTTEGDREQLLDTHFLVEGTTQTRRLLPSSSSSEVMDLERMDRAVVGALFGGGGAAGQSHSDGKTEITFYSHSKIKLHLIFYYRFWAKITFNNFRPYLFCVPCHRGPDSGSPSRPWSGAGFLPDGSCWPPACGRPSPHSPGSPANSRVVNVGTNSTY